MTDVATVSKQAFEQPEWYLAKTAYNIKIRVETLKEFTRNIVPENILDIGCGDGSLSLSLLNNDNRVTLLDRSQRMLSIATSRVPDKLLHHVAVMNNDVMSADLPVHSYDLIICVGVMAYISDREPFIRKIASALKAGGTLIIECTDGAHFMTHLDQLYEALRTRFGGRAFPTVIKSSAQLLRLLENAGFKLTGSFRYALPFPALRRLISQDSSYKLTRSIYGSCDHNRSTWLGNECLFRLQLQ